MEGCDWTQHLRVFASTGETSNVRDYLYLMSLARYQCPVLEYCGGTEIGGAHITCTVLQPQSPSVFTTPALGMSFTILQEDVASCPEAQEGEEGALFLWPPSIGLSQVLLNRDHHTIYFEGCPQPGMRRHGDQVRRLPGGRFQAMGRVDDTMNLGGIKVSSAELERAIQSCHDVAEAAAIAVQPSGGGADLLVMCCVVTPSFTMRGGTAESLKTELGKLIKAQLNPLFKIYDVTILTSLPKTASNKIMRRELRKSYLENKQKIIVD